VGREKVIETLDTLTDAAHRESPGSIIDRARDAAQWSLATWAASEFCDIESLREDLGGIIQKIKAKGDRVFLRAGESFKGSIRYVPIARPHRAIANCQPGVRGIDCAVMDDARVFARWEESDAGNSAVGSADRR
jgi:hypothetical protein